MKRASALALHHPLSGRLACAPTVRCLSNRSADVRKGRKRTRVEENSGVQKKGESRCRCGEIRTGMGCGEGPARKERGQPGRPPARGTRTIRMCSFDARTRGSTRLPFEGKGERAWRDGEERPGALSARKAPTMKRWSLDARSKGQHWPLPLVDGWSREGDGCC